MQMVYPQHPFCQARSVVLVAKPARLLTNSKAAALLCGLSGKVCGSYAPVGVLSGFSSQWLRRHLLARNHNKKIGTGGLPWLPGGSPACGAGTAAAAASMHAASRPRPLLFVVTQTSRTLTSPPASCLQHTQWPAGHGDRARVNSRLKPASASEVGAVLGSGALQGCPTERGAEKPAAAAAPPENRVTEIPSSVPVAPCPLQESP